VLTFNKIIHQHKVYLSREELRRLEQIYGTSESNSLGLEIDYIKISQELGLHKQSLDYIKTKSKAYIDQISKYKDSDSRGNLKSSDYDYSIFNNPHAYSAREDLSNVKGTSALKLRSAKEFL